MGHHHLARRPSSFNSIIGTYQLCPAFFSSFFLFFCGYCWRRHVQLAPCTYSLAFAPPFSLFIPWPQFLTTFLYGLFPNCCLSLSVTRLSSASSAYHYPRGARPTTSMSTCRDGLLFSSSTATRTCWPRAVLSPSSALLPRRIVRLLAFPLSTTPSVREEYIS